MALNPIPFVVDESGDPADAPSGAVPIALYGADGGGSAVDSVNGKTGAVTLTATDVGALPDSYTPPAPDAIVQALIAAGFGSAGQVLATNSAGNGFEWVDLPEPEEP